MAGEGFDKMVVQRLTHLLGVRERREGCEKGLILRKGMDLCRMRFEELKKEKYS